MRRVAFGSAAVAGGWAALRPSPREGVEPSHACLAWKGLVTPTEGPGSRMGWELGRVVLDPWRGLCCPWLVTCRNWGVGVAAGGREIQNCQPQGLRGPPAACVASPQQPPASAPQGPSTSLPSIHPPPGPGLACHIKFKGFKCKYFSFIDASCLQRARFLAAQLYCPISFPYLGTGEPGGLRGEGALAPVAAMELEAAPPRPAGSCVWGGLGSPRLEGAGAEEGIPPQAGEHPSDSGLPEEWQEVGGWGPSVGILLLKHKNKSSRPAHTGVL